MNCQHQKGAQAVEFALVLPFLILIIFAVLDFGILVYNKAIITNASREAVRSGTVLSGLTWDASRIALIKQVACNYAKSALITVSTGTRNATCTGTADPVINLYTGVTANCPGPTGATTPVFRDPVAVTISYAVRGFSLGTWWQLGTGPTAIGSAITLTSCTQMNHE